MQQYSVMRYDQFQRLRRYNKYHCILQILIYFLIKSQNIIYDMQND